MLNKNKTVKSVIVLVLFFLFTNIYTRAESLSSDNNFTNLSLLNNLFEKLYRLENGFSSQDKINIVHIGDSHIQADFFSNTIRQDLQGHFGNGGLGFVFPLNLAKTNGNHYITFSSNVEWNSRRNIYPVKNVSIGLSGIGLYTDKSDFVINLEVNPAYLFNTIKIISPSKHPNIKIANTTDVPLVPKLRTEIKTSTIKHKIKAGETLISIARKNSTTVEHLKKINKLHSDKILKGKILLIETKVTEIHQTVPVYKTQNISAVDSSLYTEKKVVPFCVTYMLPKLVNKISLCSENLNSDNYSLDGIVLENNKSGIIYNNIGVNGAKVSDYSKYPLFFEQLPLLSPDLIIVSFGTNESYGKWSAPYFISQIQEFVRKIKQKNPKTVILVMSPPPSSGLKNTQNVFIDSYAEKLTKLNDCVFWDLLGKVGGSEVTFSKNFTTKYMARDKVHYTKNGYAMQGELFLADFYAAYNNYVKNRKNWMQH